MEIDLELLDTICKRYGAALHRDKPGGFVFDNKEVAFQPEILGLVEEINMKNTLLEVLSDTYPQLKFKFVDDSTFKYHLLYKVVDKSHKVVYNKLEYIQKIDDVCSAFLSPDDLDELVIIYDILNEIE